MEDGESSSEKLPQLARFRDSLLDFLLERTHDVSPFTRSAVLKAWLCVVEEGSVPVRRAGAVAEAAADRLHDKNALVRKSATSLLTVVLENNPFAGNLDEAAFAVEKESNEKGLRDRVEALKIVYMAEDRKLRTVNEEEEGEGEGEGRDIFGSRDDYIDSS